MSSAGARTWSTLGDRLMGFGNYFGQRQRERDEETIRKEDVARDEERYRQGRAERLAVAGGGEGMAPTIELPIGGPSTAPRDVPDAPTLFGPRKTGVGIVGDRLLPTPDFSGMRRSPPMKAVTDPTWRQHGEGDSAFYLPDQDVAEDRAYRTGVARAADERAALLPGQIEEDERRARLERENLMAPRWQPPRLPNYSLVETDKGIIRYDPDTGEQIPTGLTSPPPARAEVDREPGSVAWDRAEADVALMFPNTSDTPWLEVPFAERDRMIRERLEGKTPTTPDQNYLLSNIGGSRGLRQPSRSLPPMLTPTDKQQAQQDPEFQQWLTQQGYTAADWQ